MMQYREIIVRNPASRGNHNQYAGWKGLDECFALIFKAEWKDLEVLVPTGQLISRHCLIPEKKMLYKFCLVFIIIHQIFLVLRV